MDFLGDYISALRGCWTLKFLHTLEIHQGLLGYTTNGDGSPKIFKGEHWTFKIWLKIERVIAYNIMVSGS